MAYLIRSAFFIGAVFVLSQPSEPRDVIPLVRETARTAARLAESPELVHATLRLTTRSTRERPSVDDESRAQLRALVASIVADDGQSRLPASRPASARR